MARTQTSIVLGRSWARARLWARLRTGGARPLPDFLIIGAQRCGTSSLYKYLSQHPAVAPAIRKETEFFSRYYSNGETWYRAHFPSSLVRRLQAPTGTRRVLTFEATPDYLLHPKAAERALDLLPEAHVIVMLRNPVERAFSHYKHMVRLGHEHLSFEDALDAEEHRLSGERERLADDVSYTGRALFRYSYFTRGVYVDQLRAWSSRYPARQLLVLRSEDFYAEPGLTYSEVLRFLGLQSWGLDHYPNVTMAESGSSHLSPTTRTALERRFEPHNRRLSEHLGADLGWD